MAVSARMRGRFPGRAAPAGGTRTGQVRGIGEERLVAGGQAAAATAVALLAFLPVLADRDSCALRLGALACAAALAAIHLAAFAHGRVRRLGPALAAQALLAYLPMLLLGTPWSTAAGFFAGGLLLAVRPARAVPGAVLACVLAGLVPARPGVPGLVDTVLAGTVSSGVAALALFGLGVAGRMVAGREGELRELKRSAVAEEHQRFSRDVHDLLGLSLSAITLKGELVDRLVLGAPERAKEELAELLTMSRRALADVRTIAAGYRELSLDDECRAAAAVLGAAGLRVTIARSGTGDLPPEVATTFAVVLREGVTNVVRHSTASWCAFSVSTEDGTAWLEIVNDGAGGAAGGTCSGSGLRNLCDRVGSLDGNLSVEVGADGTHRLVAAVPVRCPGRARDELSA